jgi:hypothetical protein
MLSVNKKRPDAFDIRSFSTNKTLRLWSWYRGTSQLGDITTNSLDAIIEDLQHVFAIMGKGAWILLNPLIVEGCTELVGSPGCISIGTLELIGIGNTIGIGIDEEIRIATCIVNEG